MFAIIGIVIVFGAVIGGYLMEHGVLAVLIQPAELVIIGGAAFGTLFIANPMVIIKKLIAGILGILKGSPYTKETYLETLKMMNTLFLSARKHGATKLEADIEEPHKSDVFTKFPKFLANHHAVDFLCDTMRMSVSGGVDAFSLDQMMELDMEMCIRDSHHAGHANDHSE